MAIDEENPFLIRQSRDAFLARDSHFVPHKIYSAYWELVNCGSRSYRIL